MRLTPVREAILSFLARRRTPASLEMVSEANGVKDECDSTTVYRTLMMFKEAELVRLVPTPQKASYFVLNTPDDMAHFLICRQCGCVTELPLPDIMSAEIKRLASTRGFSRAPQECEIHGLCVRCQIERSTQVPPSKLSSGGKTKLRRGSAL
jgi:Fe2+ or Zn2+ uptake regulation protein